MAKKHQKSVSWREKRHQRDFVDPQKVAKANRERYRRTKDATFKRANDIFVDALDTGRDRRVYVLIMNRFKSGVRYATYDSHPEEKWVPAAEGVKKHWPRSQKRTPDDYKNTAKKKDNRIRNSLQPTLKITKPPLLEF
ncbi:hypothetical protein N7492_001809 [Penicillium capsulatum]|uniref:Uncharacterized protein n=1 Tax=Penicillium capsulatum TaxID=69766 RepID=A0A9W9M022_9EURO|nr:hypothetical protein N7492_001809 [Penicillium capsulatum]KAJ6129141.1 hypothetical protein N7512_001921 [Penicillium capsulatum]